MEFVRRPRQGGCLALLVLCLGLCSPAAAQTPASGWTSLDIGDPLPGGTSVASDGFYVYGAGTDIWNQSDEFRFVYQPLTGDGAIIARVTDLGATDAWTKAGVMIRETLNPDSKHAFMLVSGTEGLAFQRRAATGGATDHTGGVFGSSPVWVKIERRGSTLMASYSSDGASWVQIGSDTITMAGTVYAGLALTSHATWAYASADFSNVSLSGLTTGSPSPSPGLTGWTSTDVGSPLLAGSTSSITDGLALTAGGTDVWGASDQFRFAYRQMTGDGSILALVRNLSAVDAWTKAGVMIRDTLAANSPHAFMFLSGTQGGAFQRRRTSSGATLSSPGPSSGAPFWVRLQRQGSTITGSYSWDGINWATAGSDTITMGSTVYVGFAITSHSAVAYSTAYFTNASIGAVGDAPAAGTGNQPPFVSLTSPASGASFAAPATITLNATASDPDGGVAVVEFYSGSVFLGSDSSSPYSFTVSGVPENTYSFTAVARDVEGAMTVSSERVVSVTSGAAAARTSQAIFAPSANEASAVSHYVLAIFPAGTDPNSSNPIASLDLGIPPVVNGESRADITTFVAGLPPGNYFAIVIAVGSGGSTASAPSPQFSR